MTSVTAVVTLLFKIKYAEEFVNKYNGRKGVLGTEKLHAWIEYEESLSNAQDFGH